MNIKDILQGHTKELLNINDDLYKERVKICMKCPLYNPNKYGGICDSALWINPDTEQVSKEPMFGWRKGCACRINAKARNKDNHCIINKW